MTKFFTNILPIYTLFHGNFIYLMNNGTWAPNPYYKTLTSKVYIRAMFYDNNEYTLMTPTIDTTCIEAYYSNIFSGSCKLPDNCHGVNDIKLVKTGVFRDDVHVCYGRATTTRTVIRYVPLTRYTYSYVGVNMPKLKFNITQNYFLVGSGHGFRFMSGTTFDILTNSSIIDFEPAGEYVRYRRFQHTDDLNLVYSQQLHNVDSLVNLINNDYITSEKKSFKYTCAAGAEFDPFECSYLVPTNKTHGVCVESLDLTKVNPRMCPETFLHRPYVETYNILVIQDHKENIFEQMITALENKLEKLVASVVTSVFSVLLTIISPVVDFLLKLFAQLLVMLSDRILDFTPLLVKLFEQVIVFVEALFKAVKPILVKLLNYPGLTESILILTLHFYFIRSVFISLLLMLLEITLYHELVKFHILSNLLPNSTNFDTSIST